MALTKVAQAILANIHNNIHEHGQITPESICLIVNPQCPDVISQGVLEAIEVLRCDKEPPFESAITITDVYPWFDETVPVWDRSIHIRVDYAEGSSMTSLMVPDGNSQSAFVSGGDTVQ